MRRLLGLFDRIDVSVQLEHVPTSGPCIIVSNHESITDPWILCLATPRRVRFMAKAELWRYPVIRWVMESYGTFPVERGSGDTGAMQRAGELLAAGELLGMFPRGTSKPAGNRRWHRGAARLALAHGAPIIPVRIENTRQVLPRRRMRVVVGGDRRGADAAHDCSCPLPHTYGGSGGRGPRLSAWSVLGLGAAIAGGLMASLWLIQARTHDATAVDVGWAYGIGLLGILDALLGAGALSQRVLEAVLVGVWSARRGSFILVRGVLGRSGEDRRYAEMRGRYGLHANRNFFFVFFEAQATLVVLFSIPLLLVSFNHSRQIAVSEWVGVLVWAFGLIGNRWPTASSPPGNATPTTGVTRRASGCGATRGTRTTSSNGSFGSGSPWSHSAPPGDTWCSSTPALLVVLIVFVTGIPPSEKQALASRGDDYRRYQRETSAFVPWFPRR